MLLTGDFSLMSQRKYKSCVAAHRKYLAFNTSCLFNHSERKLRESFEHHGQHSVCVLSMVHLCRFKSGCTSYWSSDGIYQILLLLMSLGLTSYSKALCVQEWPHREAWSLAGTMCETVHWSPKRKFSYHLFI